MVVLLVERLMEEDDTGNGLARFRRRSEQDLAEHPAVLLGVLDPDLGQAVAHRAGGLVRGKDALAGRNDRLEAIEMLTKTKD